MTKPYTELDAALGVEAPYDAHKSAKPGEPTFTFQAGDPYSANITELWAALMSADVKAVDSALSALKETMQHEVSLDNSFGNIQSEKGKIAAAYQYAIDLRDYRDHEDSAKINYDAHETARSGELTFTLQGSDPYCADFVEIWAALMTGNIGEVDMRFNQIRQTLLTQIGEGNPFGKEQMAKGKVTKAYQHAMALKKQRHTADQA